MLNLDVRAEVAAALRELLPAIQAAVRAEVEAVLREKLLTVQEAAALSGTSESALRKRIARGVLPVVRCGRVVRLRTADVLGGAR